MLIEPMEITGLFMITPEPCMDNRGYMARLLDDREIAAAGLNTRWAQESRSYTRVRNTVRGLFVSLPPATEGKTITAFRGRMFWVSVDVRAGSPTFGKWASATLCGELGNTLYAAPGFAHGCLSLTDDCDLLLRSDNYFSPEHGAGILWSDPELGIRWPLCGPNPVISERDAAYPTFAEFRRLHGGIRV